MRAAGELCLFPIVKSTDAMPFGSHKGSKGSLHECPHTETTFIPCSEIIPLYHVYINRCSWKCEIDSNSNG